MADTPLVILQPPKWGDPCNGCGVCCQEEVCEIGLAVFGKVPAPCPGLEHKNGRYVCSLIALASDYHRPFLIFRLGIGSGCDRNIGDEPNG